MDCVGKQATIDNRLGRAGGLPALRDSRLCRLDLPILDLPILTRSAALLALLLQDGSVDLELTGSVIALDPGLAFGTLKAASRECNGQSEIWQLPQAVVAAGCDRLLEIVNCARKIESSYECAAATRLRQLYMRGVQRACLAEMLTNALNHADPERAYLAGLLFDLPGMASRLGRTRTALPLVLRSALSDSLPETGLAGVAGPATAPAEAHHPIAASVLIANEVLELSDGGNPESCPQIEGLAASPFWPTGDDCSMGERRQLIWQGCRLGAWAAANAPRLSPWEFMAKLHRRKAWE